MKTKIKAMRFSQTYAMESTPSQGFSAVRKETGNGEDMEPGEESPITVLSNAAGTGERAWEHEPSPTPHSATPSSFHRIEMR